MSYRPSYSDEFKADVVALAALKHWIKLSREGQEGGGRKQEEPVDTAKYKAMETRLRELERENDFLKKCQRSSPKNNGRCELPPCSAGGERSTDTPTTIRHRELTDQVKTVFDSSDGIVGVSHGSRETLHSRQ